MIVFHVGPPQRRMVASWHAPEAELRGRVLLVSPFGQEEIRSRRLFRVVAERLVRLGWGVLRFDRYACGDADGADEEGELAGWADDLLVAAAELERRCPGAAEVWLGARLGATLALQAAPRSPQPPRLVLWDPVLDGPAYLQHLREAHVAALEAMNASPDPRWRARLAADPASYADEAMGFVLSPRLRGQIGALRSALLPAPPRVAVRVLASAADPAVLQWQSLQSSAALVQEAPPFEWTSDRAINSALVPAEVVAAVVRAVDG